MADPEVAAPARAHQEEWFERKAAEEEGHDVSVGGELPLARSAAIEIRDPHPAAAPDAGDQQDGAERRHKHLLDVISAARDGFVGVQKELGRVPGQDAYSTRMTPMEMNVARMIQDLDNILASEQLAHPAHQERTEPPDVEALVEEELKKSYGLTTRFKWGLTLKRFGMRVAARVSAQVQGAPARAAEWHPNVLVLRDIVTAAVNLRFGGLDLSLANMPSRYGDSRTIHRERAREVAETVRDVLVRELDSAILNWPLPPCALTGTKEPK